MKLNTNTGNVQISEGLRSTSFKMAATAKGFRIISQTLYKDSILAIVRELSCNAWDAHQMNGNVNQPFEVHLPNQLEPWFSIRDYGTGMSDDTVFDVYTTVFGSTKDQSNEVIGAMGLGSKTPFAYNDGQAFIVTSIHNGMKAIYSAYLKDGAPDLTCLSDPTPTNEPSGVEVSVPVTSKDFFAFKKAADTCLYTFALPSVKVNVETIKPKLIQSGTDYQIMASLPNKSGWLFAKMGSIIYPISYNNIDKTAYQTISDVMDSGTAVVIDFKIGEVDIAASREELHYDESTIKCINTKLNKIADDFLVDAQNEANSFSKKESPRTVYHALRASYKKTVVYKLTFNGKKFSEWAQKYSSSEVIRNKIVYYSKNNAGVTRRTTTGRYDSTLSALTAIDIEFKQPRTIIHDDLKSNGVKVAVDYITKNNDIVNGSVVYYYHMDKSSTLASISLTKLLHPKDFILVKTSDLKAQGFGANGSAGATERAKPVPVFEINLNDKNSRLADVSVDQTVLETGKFYWARFYNSYIEDGNGNPIIPNTFSTSPAQAIELIKNVVKSYDPNGKLYIIRRSQLSKLEKNKNAIEVMNSDLLNRYVDKQDRTSIALNDNFSHSFLAHPVFMDVLGFKLNDKLSSGHVKCLDQFSTNLKLEDERKRLQKMEDDFTKAFPMMKLINSRTDNKIAESAISILKLLKVIK